MTQDLTQVNEKLDMLIVFMEEQQSRNRAMEELRDDMIPIANHFIKLTIDELAEIGTEFRSEDLLFLLKRLLRNTHTLIRLVDQLEAVMGFADEAELLGHVFARSDLVIVDSPDLIEKVEHVAGQKVKTVSFSF